MNLAFLKLLKFFHLLNTRTYKKLRNIEIIQHSPLFNQIWYQKKYHLSDTTNLAKHYLETGATKGFNPSLQFDTKKYLEFCPDVAAAGMNPLVHYELHGKEESRFLDLTIKGIVNPKNNYAMPIEQTIRFYCAAILGKLLYLLKFKKNKHTKILVCLHLYYMEAWPLLKKYLGNLSGYDYDLIITYTNEHYNQETLDKIKEFKPNTRFYLYPNQGFDVGPFVDLISKIDLSPYDIVYKLQSKGTHRKFLFMYHQIFKNQDWMFNLYDGILGGCSVHKTIDYLLNNKTVGLVATENLITEDPKHKNAFTHQIAKEHHLKIPQNYHYVAGTCFACKAEALKPIRKKHFTIDDFAQSMRGEFSFAHAMERILCGLMETHGFKLQGIHVIHHRYKHELADWEKTSALRLLDDKRFSLDYDFFYKTLETRRVYSYDIVKVKIKDIRRRWMGKDYILTETSPYAYLQGDVERYNNYCDINSKISKYSMSKERFDVLYQSIKKSFNEKMMPVIEGECNIIQDGQHRLVSLLNLYGEDYEVKCLKLNFTKNECL